MQGIDGGKIQAGGFLQQCLNRLAILANNAEVVPAGFTSPVLYRVKGTELAEAVGGEENLVRIVIGDHDFWPVHHGSHDEGQGMGAEGEFAHLPNFQRVCQVKRREKLLHHGESLLVGNDDGLRVLAGKELNGTCMVRLHVLHYQIIRSFTAEHFVQLL